MCKKKPIVRPEDVVETYPCLPAEAIMEVKNTRPTDGCQSKFRLGLECLNDVSDCGKFPKHVDPEPVNTEPSTPPPEVPPPATVKPKK